MRKQTWLLTIRLVDTPEGEEDYLTQKVIKNYIENHINLDAGIEVETIACSPTHNVP